MSPWGALLPAAVLAPLLLAAGTAWPGTRAAALRLAPWAAGPGLLAALILPQGTAVSGEWVLLGASLALDETGRVFLGFTSLLWLLCGFYGRRYVTGDPRRVGFFAAFLLAMAGNLGLCVAGDVVGFYLGFALMTFAAYPLVVHDRSPAALAAGRLYIVLAVGGELLLFAGFALLVDAAGTLILPEAAVRLADSPRRGLVTLLLFLGFGVKAGTVPLHLWLPLAHPAAPTPASAVLSGAMIKAGLLGWLRFLPLGEAALPGLGLAAVGVGLAGAFYGVLAGLPRQDPKAVLAYSSVSQMGLMTLVVGLGLAAPETWPAGSAAACAYALHHGLAKGALFLGVGVAPGPAGWGRPRLALALGLGLPALSLAGAPFTSGAAAKAALKAAASSPGAWSAWPAGAVWLGWLLPLAAVGTTVLLARFLVLVWSRPREASGDRPSPGGLAGPWALLVLASASAAWVGPAAAHGAPDFWASLGPVGVGAAGALGVCLAGRRLGLRLPVGPVVDLSGRAAGLASRWGAFSRRAAGALDRAGRDLEGLALGVSRGTARRLQAAEACLGRWAPLGVAFLLAALVQWGLFLWRGAGEG
ncbi:MAG: complex I subunit 5 family protein [Deferrisomatales bacterium]|nr:complex I subunit 5 family protein [Deferrisomatales bacterium]